MKRHAMPWMFVLGCSVSLLIVSRGVADVPQGRVQQRTLQAVFDRIHDHAAGEDWKKEGWKDEAIEAWLEKLIAKIASGAEAPDLKLPVKMAELTAGNEMLEREKVKSLIVGKSMNFENGVLFNSVVFADGSVEVGGVNGSIIVARGAVHVRHLSTGSVIVSGSHLKARDDGHNPAGGSVLVSRGRVEINGTNGTKIVAPLGIMSMVDGQMLRNVTLINTPALPAPARAMPLPQRLAAQALPKNIEIADLPVETMAVHKLAKEVTFEGEVFTAEPNVRRPTLVRNLKPYPSGAILRHEGRRYIADRNLPITEASGSVAETLKNWKLSFVDERFAVLSSESEDVVLELEAK